MPTMKQLLPEGDYKIKTVGPSREWSFKGNDGEVLMATDSVQLEGHEQYWIDLNRSRSADAPASGATIKGHIEQDEDGKYPPKFVKEKKSGGGWPRGGGGGGQASPGAIWATAVETSVQVVSAYATISGKKPKTIDEFLARVEQIAPKVNAIVDKLVAANKPAEKPAADTATSEAGETPAAAAAPKKADVEIDDIDEEDLGPW